MREILHDFAYGFLPLDTKAWRTFPVRVVRPGTLIATLSLAVFLVLVLLLTLLG